MNASYILIYALFRACTYIIGPELMASVLVCHMSSQGYKSPTTKNYADRIRVLLRTYRTVIMNYILPTTDSQREIRQREGGLFTPLRYTCNLPKKNYAGFVGFIQNN